VAEPPPVSGVRRLAGALVPRSRRGRTLAGAGLLLVGVALWVRLGPLPEGFLDPAPHRSVKVVDRRGRLLYESLSEREARSVWLRADALPQCLVDATLAAEDHRFFRHPGVDPLALARAAWKDLKAMRVVEGGSTLTQQVVKQLTSRRRTVAGKLGEMVLALRLEHRLSKRQVLALYLNLAPYGNQYVGAEAAARGYFGAPVASLTPAQAAFLAGLPQRPSAFDPYTDLAAATARQRVVLGRMRALGLLDREAYELARKERLAFRRAGRTMEAPHFVLRALAEAGPEAPALLRTTLDLELQREVAGALSALGKSLAAHGAKDAAVVVLDVPTGEVLAYEGSGDYFDPLRSGAVDGAATPRQPGSALKPFTYALAFERGFTPASVLPDVPSHFPTAEPGVAYAPRNYDGVFRGPLRARAALAGSVNVPAVWLLSQVGVPDLLERLRDLGFTTLDRTADYYGYGLTLGDAEVRLDELTVAYADLARGGLHRPLRLLGDREESPAAPRRLFSSESVFWVTDILADPEARAFIFGRGGSLELPFPAAAKTGTSQAYHDNWALGYTREVAVGVWVGNFDRAPLTGSSGVTGAGPLFHQVMMAAEASVLGRLPGPLDPPLATAPPGARRTLLCTLSGGRAGADCPSTTAELFPEDRVPPPCAWHVPGVAGAETRWPSEFRGWALQRGLLSTTAPPPALPPLSPGAPAHRPSAPPAFSIANPPAGSVYLVDPTLRSEFQALPLRVVAEGPPREVIWSVDGREVGRAPSDRPLPWPLVRGEHRIAARDSSGHRDEVVLVVR